MSKKSEQQKTALVLRSCSADMTSKKGFVWPDVGEVAECPDWKPIAECGNGLHGWLYGQGDHDCSNYLSADSKWLVVEVVLADVVMLGGKCKFPRGTVKFIGTMTEAAAYLREHEPMAREVAVIGATISVDCEQCAIAGALSTLTGGYRSTLTGGYCSTLTGGNDSTLTGGNRSTLTGGDDSTLTGGYCSTLTGGDGSTLTGGNDSTLTGGNRSTLTGGDRSTLTGGDDSTLTGGYCSTLTGGDDSTLTGGDGSELRIRYWDGNAERWRTVIGYVGEDGLQPCVPYRLDENHKFVEVKNGYDEID